MGHHPGSPFSFFVSMPKMIGQEAKIALMASLAICMKPPTRPTRRIRTSGSHLCGNVLNKASGLRRRIQASAIRRRNADWVSTADLLLDNWIDTNVIDFDNLGLEDDLFGVDRPSKEDLPDVDFDAKSIASIFSTATGMQAKILDDFLET